MKKILLFGAALIAAMSINAQDPIPATCAEAAAAKPAQSGEETQDTYIVTGYITNTNGTISKGQQTFYMDDNKGSKKTLQGYWCNLPEGETNPLNVGDKITLTGKIMNYNGTAEIKNGNVAILERVSVTIDTIDVSVCDALEIGETLNAGDYTDDVFKVYGRLKGPATENTTNHYYDGEMACGDKIFKPYHCSGEAGLNLGKGDSVVVIGKLFNYNGTIEISNGKIELIERSQEDVVIIEANVGEATEAALSLANNAKSEDIYAVTGYIDSIAVAYDDTYKNISFFMTDDLANPTYDFEAFRVKCTADDAVKLIPGAKVTVTAQLQHYYKAATEELPEVNLAETVAGGTFVFAEETQAVETVRSEATTRKRIENGQLVIIRDGVKFNALGTVVK